MTYKYGTASKLIIKTLTKPLQEVLNEAIKIVDIQMIGGIRTYAQQVLNVRNNVSKTLDSKHLPQPPDNLSHAFDCVVFPVDWDALEKGFAAVKRVDPGLKVLEHFHMLGVLKGIAHMQGTKLRQGIDWNEDGDFANQTFNDMPHSEKK